jgi:ubiquinone/menaquinone biosynthesis C-methylase UbiE
MTWLPHGGERGDQATSSGAQQVVSDYFDAHVGFWEQVYDGRDVFALIHRERWRRTLVLVDSLSLPPRSPVLEIGCGTGLLAVALASRGFEVDATDSSPEMVRATQQRACQEGLDASIRCRVADAHRLEAPTGRYRLVLALGVVPWLHSPSVALREMAKVLEPGGYLIVNADNRHRLVHLLDPMFHPGLDGVRGALRRRLAAWGRRPADHAVARPRRQSLAQFDQLLVNSGFEKLAGSTLGFGPFTLLGRSVLLPKPGVRLHKALQRTADNGAPIVRSLGSQYLVLARKSARPAGGEHRG